MVGPERLSVPTDYPSRPTIRPGQLFVQADYPLLINWANFLWFNRFSVILFSTSCRPTKTRLQHLVRQFLRRNKLFEIMPSTLYGERPVWILKLFFHVTWVSGVVSVRPLFETIKQGVGRETKLTKCLILHFYQSNAVQKYEGLALPAVRVLVQHLCMKVPDQAEFRNSAGKVILYSAMTFVFFHHLFIIKVT